MSSAGSTRKSLKTTNRCLNHYCIQIVQLCCIPDLKHCVLRTYAAGTTLEDALPAALLSFLLMDGSREAHCGSRSQSRSIWCRLVTAPSLSLRLAKLTPRIHVQSTGYFPVTGSFITMTSPFCLFVII